MNICRFNKSCLGLVEGDVVFDISECLDLLPARDWPPAPGDPLIANLSDICAAAYRLRKTARTLKLQDVALYSPVCAPSKIMAAPANYRAHIEIDAQDPAVNHGLHNIQLQGVERPVEKLGLFLKASSALVGPEPGIELQWRDRRNDYEVELAVIIGRIGKNVPAADALSYVAGYSVGLDITVRGTEDRSFRKSADGYAVLGPWLTTADAIGTPETLTIWLELNGESRQCSTTGAMIVGIPRLIELASSVYTLWPGDVILTGSPEGVGAIVPGDVIRAGCDRIGEMTVPVR